MAFGNASTFNDANLLGQSVTLLPGGSASLHKKRNLPTPPPLGYTIPNRDHAISVQFPSWEDVCGYATGNPAIVNSLQNGYPRTFLHKDVQAFLDKCGQVLLATPEELAVFPDYHTAADCKSFMTSHRINPTDAAKPEEISIMAVDLDKGHGQSTVGEEPLSISRVYAVVHPARVHGLKMTFWRLTGRGISSRMAQQCLESTPRITKATGPPPEPFPAPFPPIYNLVRDRVAEFLERAPLNPQRSDRARRDDVYLYPSGMAALYHVHHSLLDWRYADIIMLGFPYELSIKMIEIMGAPYRFFSLGTDSEIDELEAMLIAKSRTGSKVQAVWCECPNNPMLRMVDLGKVRKLADKFDFLFVVDDTIGSFANIDVLDVADVVVTSLSKNFSGFGDVLAGSVYLNPNFPHYDELKSLFNGSYVNNLYVGDAIQLELNSRDYLKRFSLQNDTASYLVDYLHPYVFDPNSALTNVYYPKVCWSKDNYRAFMRTTTEDFEPGFGGLFSVDFENTTAASAFFDNLYVHKGPSFGAHITISIPYVQLVMQKQKEWAASHGLKETLVRVSVGLEDKEALLECIKRALKAADATKENT
ncbi:hypothetical protein N7449_005972 [Penicillium cf. viridicatum]|uniref:Cystathionine gamma-synthase n=1 Tax=Penicillium cf. viridicatum TaxID=2972119 RepID=A0A9W9SWG4_9EURO|nr:hypothetical protein N7449_005972 [Penicillium cf. viridicatum]